MITAVYECNFFQTTYFPKKVNYRRKHTVRKLFLPFFSFPFLTTSPSSFSEKKTTTGDQSTGLAGAMIR